MFRRKDKWLMQCAVKSETGESRTKAKYMTHSCGMSVSDLGDSEKEYIWGRVMMSSAMSLSHMRCTVEKIQPMTGNMGWYLAEESGLAI